MAVDMNNFKQSLKNNCKAIALGLTPFIILVIIFTLPLKVVPIQVAETYWATEMKSEPYTGQETYQDTEAYTATETRTDTVYDSYVNTSSWSYSFNVNKPGATVYVSTQGSSYSYYYRPFYILNSGDETNCASWPYYNWYWDGYSGRDKVTIKVSYPEEVTKYRTVTKTRDVTKYREVTVQVQKEKTVTKYVRMSIWQYLFLDIRQKEKLPEA